MHSQNSGDDRGLQEKLPCTHPTHHHEQYCDCSGVIQIPGHHHLSGPEVGHSHWLYCKMAQQRLYFLHQLRKLNLPQELLKQFYSTITESVLCSSLTVCLVQLLKQTSEDYNGQSGLLRGLSVLLCPASENCTPPDWGEGLRKSLWTPHTQLTLSLNCCPLTGATDHWAPKQPDTRTVLTQAISHLNNT